MVRVGQLYSSFKLRLTLLCMLAVFVVLSIVHVAFYTTTKNMVVDYFGTISQSCAVSVSLYIMRDAGGYKQFLETRDVGSDYYREMQNYLAAVKNAGGVRFIYTERKIDDKTVEFILDAEPIGSELYSPPGSTTFMDEASRLVYATGRPAKLQPTHSDYETTLLGGCAPIFDANGDILGLVGVNLDIAEVNRHMNRLRFVMITIYLFTAALILLLINRYSGAILEPLMKDKLTGAYNRRYMDKLLQKQIRLAVRNGTKLTALMCDLDHFKNINDTYGHAFGDSVLASVSQTVMDCLRKDDYFFRYGGEEFVVLIAKADEEKMFQIAERIRASVEKSGIFNRDTGTNVKMTISIGIAFWDSATQDSKHFIENADKALYDAKKTRNKVSVFANT